MPRIATLLRKHGLDALTVLALISSAYLMSAPLRERWARGRAERASVAAAKREWENLRSEVSPISGDGTTVQVVEISDYECPFCRRSAAAVDSAVTSGLRIGYLNYPLAIHPHAEGAAIASMCAESSGRFREMHARLMGSTDWQKDSDWMREARLAGVADLPGFERCIHGNAVKARLARERALADSLGMSGTPTFVSKGAFHRGSVTSAELLALGREE